MWTAPLPLPLFIALSSSSENVTFIILTATQRKHVLKPKLVGIGDMHSVDAGVGYTKIHTRADRFVTSAASTCSRNTLTSKQFRGSRMTGSKENVSSLFQILGGTRCIQMHQNDYPRAKVTGGLLHCSGPAS